MTTASLATLENNLSAAKARLGAARAALAASLAQVGAGPEALEPVLAHGDEYGVPYTLEAVLNNPAQFGISGDLSKEQVRTLRTPLLTACEASQTADLAMADREAALAASNPRHVPAVLIAGREAELGEGRIRFRDTGTYETVQLSPVEPRHDAPTLTQDRERPR